MKPIYLLKNAAFFYDKNDTERATGNVYGHPLFLDGEPIITSEIIGFDIQNEIIETKNSHYEIQNWHRRKEDKDRDFHEIPPLTEDQIREIFGWFSKSFRAKGVRQCD